MKHHSINFIVRLKDVGYSSNRTKILCPQDLKMKVLKTQVVCRKH